MPPLYAPREQEYPEYEFLRRNLQQGRGGSRYNPAFEALPQLINTPNFLTPPVAPGEGKGPGVPAMPPIFMPGWTPPAGTSPPAPPGAGQGAPAVTGEEAMIRAAVKGQGGIETRGPFFPMPPMVKPAGSTMWQGNQYGTSPGQIQTGPQVYNGPTPFGDFAPPPPPGLNQFMAARVPMMPPAYADVQMEARNNALQANARGDAMSDWAGMMDRYNRLNFDRQTQAADWTLRRDLGMGGLGLQQRQIDLAAANAAFEQKMKEQGLGLERDRFAFDRQKYEQGRSPVEQERAIAATLLGAGKTPAEVQDFLDWWRQQYPAATFGSPPAPGDSPGTAKGGAIGNTPPPPPPNTLRGAIWDPIRSELNALGAKTPEAIPKAGVLSKETARTPGEFFRQLQLAKGDKWISQNAPAISAYMESVYGSGDISALLQPPRALPSYIEVIPGGLAARGAIQNFSSWMGPGFEAYVPPGLKGVSLSREPWWRHLGPFLGAPVNALTDPDIVYPGTQPTSEQRGRAAFRQFAAGLPRK